MPVEHFWKQLETTESSAGVTVGPTRVAAHDSLILVGGADGTCTMLTTKRPKSPQLWSIKAHDGQVTCVIIRSDKDVAFSSGRDGAIMVYTKLLTGAPKCERICRVTGEVNAISMSASGSLLMIGGDSLRKLMLSSEDIGENLVSVSNVPMAIPAPIISLAISPCEGLVAMASAGGGINVVSIADGGTGVLPVSSTQQTQTQAGLDGDAPLIGVNLVLDRALSVSRKTDETTSLKMSWMGPGSSPGTSCLAVPTLGGVRIFQFERGDGESPHAIRGLGMVEMPGTIEDATFSYLISSSKHKFWCVASNASKTRAESNCVIIAKASFQNNKVTTKSCDTIPCYDETDSTAVTTVNCLSDVSVDPVHGHLVFATNTGTVDVRKKVVRVEKVHQPTTVSQQQTESVSQRSAEAGGDSGDDDNEKGEQQEEEEVMKNKKKHHKKKKRHYSDSVSSSEGEEDLGEIVDDLIDNNKFFTGNEGKSKRRLVEPSLSKQQLPPPSSFLDDEADEEDEEAEEDGMIDDFDDVDEDSLVRRDREVDDEEDEMTDDNDDHRRHGRHQSGRHPNSQHTTPKFVSLPSTHVIMKDLRFQPGATCPSTALPKAADEEGQDAVSRPTELPYYLAFNSIGAVRRSGDTVFTNFHDLSKSGIKMIERRTCKLGALGVSGLALVLTTKNAMNLNSDFSAEQDEESIPVETLYFRTFVSIGVQTDFSVSLAVGEQATHLAVGQRYVAVITNFYLRVFSPTGLELSCVSPPGESTIAISGLNSEAAMKHPALQGKDPLAMVTCNGLGKDLKLSVFDISSYGVNELIPVTNVPMTEAPETDGGYAALRWIGWSDDGIIHTADSAGVVRMLTQEWGRSWMPVYDPRHIGEPNKLWVWGATSEKLLAYSCSLNETEPIAGPSFPACENVKKVTPLLRSLGDKQMLTREAALRAGVRLQELKKGSHFYTETIAKGDVQHDKHLLELFTVALRDLNSSRAIDVATMFQLRESLETAARMANEKGQQLIVDRLVILIQARKGNKRRKVCQLPVEGSEVSEKDRDRLLRQLLAKQQQTVVTTPQDAAPSKGDKTVASLPTVVTDLTRTDSVSPGGTNTKKVISFDEEKNITVSAATPASPVDIPSVIVPSAITTPTMTAVTKKPLPPTFAKKKSIGTPSIPFGGNSKGKSVTTPALKTSFVSTTSQQPQGGSTGSNKPQSSVSPAKSNREAGISSPGKKRRVEEEEKIAAELRESTLSPLRVCETIEQTETQPTASSSPHHHVQPMKNVDRVDPDTVVKHVVASQNIPASGKAMSMTGTSDESSAPPPKFVDLAETYPSSPLVLDGVTDTQQSHEEDKNALSSSIAASLRKKREREEEDEDEIGVSGPTISFGI